MGFRSIQVRSGKLFTEFGVHDGVSIVPRPYATSTESSVPGSRSWLRRVLFAPGRVFFLAVLSLMELWGLPKIKQLPSSGRDGKKSPERVQ